MDDSLIESRKAWQTNAQYWDEYMGDESNDFHRNIVRPDTDDLLQPSAGDRILEIACGNGNYAQYLAKKGATVVAFDYSSKMIELAKKRRSDVLDQVDFRVCDASNIEEIRTLRGELPYNKAVSNMGIMDITDIQPMFQGVSELLEEGGIFVCSTHHPCFTYPEEDYFSESVYMGEALPNQPKLQCYYQRPIQSVLNLAFSNGFVLDGFYEEPYEGEEVPIIMIMRFRKLFI